MTQLPNRVLIVAGTFALTEALMKYPGACVVIAETQRHESPLLDLEKFAAAASDQPPSRGPAPRRRFPVRR